MCCACGGGSDQLVIIEPEIIPVVEPQPVIDPITRPRPIVEVIEEPQTGGEFPVPPVPELIEEPRTEGPGIPPNRVLQRDDLYRESLTEFLTRNMNNIDYT